MKEIKIRKQGFTLIELLVVVLIIGILAAIALPEYQLAVDKARYSALMNITRAIADANEIFYLVNGKYSTDFGELDIDLPTNDISGRIAFFDWGNCQLVSQQEIQCTNNTSLRNQYIIHYDAGTGSKSHGIFCTAGTLEENSRYDKVCKGVGESGYDCSNCCNFFGDCRVYTIRR